MAPFEAAVRGLNPLVAVKVRSAAVHSALATVYFFTITSSLCFSELVYSRSDDATAIYVDVNTRIQILDSVSHLPKADKEQCGAFIVISSTFIKLRFELKKVFTSA